MTNEFLAKFLPEFAISPSPSEADNALVGQLVQVLSNNSVYDHDLTIRCLLAWQTKKLPRYLVNDQGDLMADNLSGPLWSPAFYRVNASLDHLRVNLEGAKVIDPFAGSGSLIHALLSLNIPEEVMLNDLSYKGGTPIWESESSEKFYYDPAQNLREYVKLFEAYGDFVSMPNFDKISGYEANDMSQRLPFDDNEFDWVFSDPPYGKSMKTKGCDGLLEYLPEILRVSRNGAMLLIPEHWLPTISTTGTYKVENLTGTLAHQRTNFKTTLAHVYQ